MDKKSAASNSDKSEASNKSDTQQQMMIGAVLSMSWQLAVVVIIPLLGGYQIDQRLSKSPLFTMIGLLLTMIGMILVVLNSIQDLNKFMGVHSDGSSVAGTIDKNSTKKPNKDI